MEEREIPIMTLTGQVLMALMLQVTKVQGILPPPTPLPPYYILFPSGPWGTTDNQHILQASAGVLTTAFVIHLGTQALISIFVSSYTLNSKFTVNSL